MTSELVVTHTLVHGANGKAIDVYGPAEGAGAAPVVLLWHGTGPDERAMLAPVARAAAARGLVVFVPDWRSDAPDRGRAHLLDSLTHAHDHAAEHGGDAARLVVAGWSAGAGAAAGLATHPGPAGHPRPTAVVGIAGRYDVPARTTGRAPLDDLAERDGWEGPGAGGPGAAPVPVRLVHGTRDDTLDSVSSRRFAAALGRHGWPVGLEEVPTDHAGVVMTRFDPAAGHCVPDTAPHAVEGGRTTVRALLEASRGLVRPGILPLV
ncbi:alpha/beta hydrolase [Streptomyces eurocidicus]|uniref:Acetyl esterase/lipase n=1 Tax=Streptomyces eurocidicus TaxID=66423 RepID=A0A7W8F678_STREU|nr:alpha/beta hydrolase fold domain-containing protein [Streptomyces eurocidicus]MBB5122884.1 acetyl esterase/lipase [Streptomyces eurocidicus]